MIHPQNKTKTQPRALVLLFVLLAMGLRVLYTPIHLAQEEHFGAGGHPLSHAAEGEGHADDDHEHDDDHLPHPSLDHASDLIAQRTQRQQRSVDLPALPIEEGWSRQAPRQVSTMAAPEPRPPKPKPRPAPRPRGPPAAA
jgi:hypothetical protein